MVSKFRNLDESESSVRASNPGTYCGARDRDHRHYSLGGGCSCNSLSCRVEIPFFDRLRRHQEVVRAVSRLVNYFKEWTRRARRKKQSCNMTGIERGGGC